MPANTTVDKNTSGSNDIHDYAGGWITERKGTGVPAFLRFVYCFVASGCIAYLMVYMYGETTHDDRGALVREFNRVTGTSEGLIYFIAALAAVFFVCMIAFAFSSDAKSPETEKE